MKKYFKRQVQFIGQALKRRIQFLGLVVRTARINFWAALLLLRFWLIWTSFDFRPGGKLIECMVWGSTSQGTMYWMHISRKLGEMQ